MWLWRCVSGVCQSFTQEQFVARFGFWLASLRQLEHGDRASNGAALVMLNATDGNPRMVMLSATRLSVKFLFKRLRKPTFELINQRVNVRLYLGHEV